MALQASTIMIGVRDVERAKQFYAEGMGCEIKMEYPGFVTLGLGGDGSLALYEWDAVAQDAGVSPEGSGFRGVSFHFLVDAREEVDRVIGAAEKAGGSVVKAAEAQEWGGYSGYFADPDGHLWKVATTA